MSICEAAQALNEPSRKGRIANRIRNARKPFDPPRSGIIGRPPPKRGLTVVNRCERIVERRVAERSAIGCRTCSFTETNNALQAFGLFTGLQKRRLELLEPFGSGTLSDSAPGFVRMIMEQGSKRLVRSYRAEAGALPHRHHPQPSPFWEAGARPSPSPTD